MATNGVTWKWVAGSALSLLLLGGAGWVGTLTAQLNRVQEKQEQDRTTVNAVDKKVGVIEEQTTRTREDVKEIKEQQKEQTRILNELLRRSR